MFSSIFLLQKLNLNYSDPLFSIGFRMTLSGIILMYYMKIKKNIEIKKNHIKTFIYLTVFNIYLTNVLEILGLNLITSSKTCLIYSISPFITAVIAFFILNEKLSKKKLIGIFIGLTGIIPLIEAKTINISNNNIGEIYIILAVIFNCIGWIMLKKIIKLGYSIILANSFSMLIGGILILIHSQIIGENWIKPLNNEFKNFMIITTITALISNVICYNLFGYLLKYFTTTFMTFAGLITPFFASFFGWIFLKETITCNFLLSFILFIIGLIIFYKDEIK